VAGRRRSPRIEILGWRPLSLRDGCRRSRQTTLLLLEDGDLFLCNGPEIGPPAVRVSIPPQTIEIWPSALFTSPAVAVQAVEHALATGRFRSPGILPASPSNKREKEAVFKDSTLDDQSYRCGVPRGGILL
jgi:hypothetical protein